MLLVQKSDIVEYVSEKFLLLMLKKKKSLPYKHVNQVLENPYFIYKTCAGVILTCTIS